MRKLGVVFGEVTPKMFKFEIVIGEKREDKRIYVWQSDLEQFLEGKRKSINFYILEEVEC